MSADLVPVRAATCGVGDNRARYHVSTQTEWLGHKQLHKAIQFPEVAYCKEEQQRENKMAALLGGHVASHVVNVMQQPWKQEAPSPPIATQQVMAPSPGNAMATTPGPRATPASPWQQQQQQGQQQQQQQPVVKKEPLSPTERPDPAGTRADHTAGPRQQPPGDPGAPEPGDRIIVPRVSSSDSQTVAQAVQSVVSPGQNPGGYLRGGPFLGGATYMYPQYYTAATPMYNQYVMPGYGYTPSQYGYVMMGGAAPPPPRGNNPPGGDGEGGDAK